MISWTNAIKKQRGAHTELDYIQSTGTQFIDTGIVVNDNIRNILTISDVVGVSGYNNALIMSASTRWANNSYLLALSTSGFRWMLTNANVYFKNGYNIDKATIELYRNYVKYNDEVISSSTASVTFSNAATLRLFGDNRWTDANVQWAQCKIYGVKIYDDETLARDLIPVLKDDVPCMYDKVTGQYFYNSGTGNFLYGLKG